MNSKLTAPRLVIIVAAIAAIVAFFLPFVSMIDDYRDICLSMDIEIYEGADLRTSDLADVSLYEYAKVYFSCGDKLFDSKNAGILYGCLYASLAVLPLFVILAALKKKPILTVLLALLMAVAFYTINRDIFVRGIMPTSTLEWGVSHSVFYPVTAVITICAIWLFALKRKTDI